MKTILIWCMLDNMFGQYDGHTKREMEYKVASRVEDIRDQLMYQLATNSGLNYPTYEMFVKYIIKNFPDVVKWDKEKENWIDTYTGEVL